MPQKYEAAGLFFVCGAGAVGWSGGRAARLAIRSVERYRAPATSPANRFGQVTVNTRTPTTPYPFFCVGGLGMPAHYLAPLARALGDAVPCYSFHLPGSDGGEEPLDDVGRIAARFVRDVRRIQPQGPYLLGGHSFGGILAYEMGRQLRGQGEPVARVLLFDTQLALPDQPAPAADGPVALRELLALRHLFCHAVGECTCGVDPSVPLFRQAVRIARALGARHPDSFEDHLLTLLNVYQAGQRAFAGYQPPPSDLPVTLIRPRDGFAPLSRIPSRVPVFRDSPYNGWEHAVLGDFRLVSVTGGHISMFTPPHLWDLAAAVAVFLGDAAAAAADAAATSPGTPAPTSAGTPGTGTPSPGPGAASVGTSETGAVSVGTSETGAGSARTAETGAASAGTAGTGATSPGTAASPGTTASDDVSELATAS
jgi:thioesterase domain-containing protein